MAKRGSTYVRFDSTLVKQEDGMQAHVTSPDGTPIAYWRSGEGPPLVTVHGATQDHTGFASLLPLLESQFTVFTLDRRGRGDSGDAAEYAVEREYDDVVAVVDAVADLTGQPVFLYGLSYGATCALGATPLTGNVGRLVLYEPGFAGVFDYPAGWLDRLSALCAEGRNEEALELILRERAGATDAAIEAVRALPNWPARAANVGVALRELTVDATLAFEAEAYRTVEVPTLLLVGERSSEGQHQISHTIAAALPDGEVVELAGQGHFAQVQAPQLVANELVRWQK